MQRRHPFECVLLVLVLLLTWQPAFPQDKSNNQKLQEAKILYENQQYSDALTRLKAAIKTQGNSRKDIVEIYKYMGFIYIIQGQKKYAKRAFELLLKVDPNYEMNPLLTSPKILNFFNEVRDEQRKKDQVLMKHTPLDETEAFERVDVKAYVVDLQNKLFEMKLFFRRRGDPNFSVAQMTAQADTSKGRGAKTYSGTIPFIWTVYDETELFVEYYIAALDKGGKWVANSGSPKEPFGFRVNLMQGQLPEGTRQTPLVKSWWFWTLIGVGVAGVAAGATVLGIELNKPPGPPTTGEAVLVFQ